MPLPNNTYRIRKLVPHTTFVVMNVKQEKTKYHFSSMVKGNKIRAVKQIVPKPLIAAKYYMYLILQDITPVIALKWVVL